MCGLKLRTLVADDCEQMNLNFFMYIIKNSMVSRAI